MTLTEHNCNARAAHDQTSGLVVERRRTTAGVDPYDQFLWSNRDVVLRNWRDGSVNFEQRGVEFPVHWSDNAVNIVTSKYFRGRVGSAQREASLRTVIDRVVGVYRAEGLAGGYFATGADADAFADELRYALVDQQFAFNSPVWFNVGATPRPQVSACYILSVDDTVESILGWYVEEGLIFRGGSGAGVNLSRIRSSKEHLSSGGNASGPVSFMRGADASAGTIKSGGATRRAAKMVILDVDHPDIVEFVRTKADEEHKIRVLRDAGFDMDLGGKDAVSVQYQNANNSVRVTDEFMDAVVAGVRFGLRARTTGEVVETVDARELFDQIATAAWECADPGIQYDGTIQRWHTLPNEGRITATNPCSEYVHLDNSSCNLASIRLTRFYDPDTGVFDVDGFRYLVRLVMIAAEISVSFGSFPTDRIGEVTRDARPIGLGYTDLGAMLVQAGVAYDSDEGRAWAAGVTSLLTAEAYRTSSEMAAAVGPFRYFAANRDAMLDVIDAHAAAAHAASRAAGRGGRGNLDAVHAAAVNAWAGAVSGGRAHGFRNSQATVLAPTGTISFFMDATTTGIEPDLALQKVKKVADGSMLTIVNEQVPVGLRSLGYDPDEVEAITAHVAATGSVVGAPGFDPAHTAVFATAIGDNVVSPDGHLAMMAAVQPLISGAISKTVNLPESATVADIADIYLRGWQLGLKCVAVYRDNCKVGQPLSAKRPEGTVGAGPAAAVVEPVTAQPARTRLPRTRQAVTYRFSVGGAKGYATVGLYDDGRPGELFLKMSKPGSTLSGVMDGFAAAVSIGLQYGTPLRVFCNKFLNSQFEPAGITDDPDIRIAKSVLDYVFRRLAVDFLDADTRAALGVATTAERTAALDPTSPDAVRAALDEARQAPAPPRTGHGPQLGDGPMCFDCGVTMRRAGSCHVCPSCSATSGCS